MTTVHGRKRRPASTAALVLIAAMVLGSVTAARAYRPPARSLLERAAARQIERGTRSLKVEAESQGYDASGAARGPAVVERLLVAAPGSMRRERDTVDGLTLEIRSGDKVTTREPDQREATTRAPVDVLFNQITTAPPLDDTQSTERMVKDLKASGINTEVVSYARFDGRVSYLIGSKSWETDKSQLWLDKESLLVTRLVVVTKGADGKVRRVDTRYLGWGSPVGGNWFPASIEVFGDDRLTSRTVVRSVERNLPTDATSFTVR